MDRSNDRRDHMEAMLARPGIANMRVKALDAWDPAAQQQVIKWLLEIISVNGGNPHHHYQCKLL